jgi:hypothetical protein
MSYFSFLSTPPRGVMHELRYLHQLDCFTSVRNDYLVIQIYETVSLAAALV